MSSQRTKTLTLFIIMFSPIFLLERIFMSSRTTKILKLLTIGLIPILIIITTVRLLATDQYLAFEYGKDSFPPDSFGFTQQQRFDLASSNIHYVRAHLPDNALSNQVLNRRPFIARAKPHTWPMFEQCSKPFSKSGKSQLSCSC